MGLNQNDKIISIDLNALKQRIIEECNRRVYTGTHPTTTNTLSSSQTIIEPPLFDSIVNPLIIIDEDKINYVTDDYEIINNLTAIENQLTNLEAKIVDAEIDDGCKGACTGLCHTACSTGCRTGCKGTCKNGCGGNCSGGCGGTCKGCDNTCNGCSGCGGCDSVRCKGTCIARCASTCGSGCSSESAGGCRYACGANCGSGCSTTCAATSKH